MDYETVEADTFGASLTGIGLNILVRDVRWMCRFLAEIFGAETFQVTEDFAIIRYHGSIMQLHSDGTYHSNPLPSLIPEAGARGGGAEFRFYHTDPDQAESTANARGDMILQTASEKPHGLREVYILCQNGYAWVASRPL